MYRTAIEELRKWKDKKAKKPLIIRGARQVGKTWLMKEFGRTDYDRAVYVNFDNNRPMKALFSADMDVRRITAGLELYTNQKIDPANTLLIFDEVQEVPQALSSLKYFNELAPEYQIICAGSLLGTALHHGTSFPVGKVEFLDLYPLSFSEFMLAVKKEKFAALLHEYDFAMVTAFKHEYIELLKKYYFIGGMPEAVMSFIEDESYGGVREIQRRILDAYEQDFSKHAPNEVVPKIRMLWNSIPSQLAKENKKFIYGAVKEGARAREYELALLWLSDCGLVHKVNRAAAPKLPLKAYEDLKAFKLFIVDVGLLACMTGLDKKILMEGNDLFKEFKGALTEQYVLQQMKTVKGINVYYWTNDRGGAEIDFLIDNGSNVIPVEVKAETNLQAKSLKTFYEKFKPETSVRISMSDYKDEGWLKNLPLYATDNISRYADLA